MLRGKRERRCAAAGVSDQVETIEPSLARLPENPCDLRVEAVVRRRMVVRVDLEVLGDCVDPVSDYSEKACVRRLRRQHSSGEQDDLESAWHLQTPYFPSLHE